MNVVQMRPSREIKDIAPGSKNAFPIPKFLISISSTLFKKVSSRDSLAPPPSPRKGKKMLCKPQRFSSPVPSTPSSAFPGPISLSSDPRDMAACRRDSSVTTCMICFSSRADAVFFPCGHGGLCYACAMEIWDSQEICHLCRVKVAEVVQLDTTLPKSETLPCTTHCQRKVLAVTRLNEREGKGEGQGEEEEEGEGQGQGEGEE